MKKILSIIMALCLGICLVGEVSEAKVSGATASGRIWRHEDVYYIEFYLLTNSKDKWACQMYGEPKKAYPKKWMFANYSYRVGSGYGNGKGKYTFIVTKKRPMNISDYISYYGGMYTALKKFKIVTVKYKIKKNKFQKIAVTKVKRHKPGDTFYL